MQTILGVEGGGTKTAWVLVKGERSGMSVITQGKLPAANLRLTPPDRLRAILAALPREAQRVGVFLAGCVTAQDRRQLTDLCFEVWPSARIVTGSDRDSGMAAALGSADGIAVNAGTGSSITGRCGEQIEKAGGWGHILGDAGGGYYLSLQALRLVLREYDLRRGEAEFAADVLRALSLNNFDELVRWAQTADKMQIATLAPVIFQAAERGDAAVQQILDAGARVLAEYTSAVAQRLGLEAPSVVVLGGLFEGCKVYVSAFERELTVLMPRANVKLTDRPPEFGAVWLAAEERESLAVRISRRSADRPSLDRATTEGRNPRSALLDQMSTRVVVELFVDEERFVQDALRACIPQLTEATDRIVSALRGGGRLFYVGAGTSGRLGVLEASEIPPTFGAPPELVQGIVAGGVTALYRSAEAAEDETAGGALAVDERGLRAGDVLCGITASGRAPFVLGALTRSKTIGATTILLTCNPAREKEAAGWDVEIDLPTGAEIVTGSTRLKAGTATKVALNILTTGAMVALGKVRGNLMIDVVASNAKLRDRAARIVAELANCTYDEALERLMNCGGNVRAAIDSFDALIKA